MKRAMAINVILTMVSGLALVLYAFDNLQNILIFIGLGVLAI